MIRLSSLFRIQLAPKRGIGIIGLQRACSGLPPNVAVPFALVAMGVKPSADISVHATKAGSLRNLLKDAAVHYAEPLYLTDEGWRCFLISADEDILRELVRVVSRSLTGREDDGHSHKHLGSLFGYPGCCIQRFIQEFTSNPKWAGYMKESRAPDKHDGTLHFWCSPDCSDSLRLQRDHLRIITSQS